MNRRYWLSKNIQTEAFKLFSHRYSIIYVANFLGITIDDARKHKELLDQGDEVSPEGVKDINDFYESGRLEKEREESLELLALDLYRLKKEDAEAEEARHCLTRTLNLAKDAREVLVFSGNAVLFPWMRDKSGPLVFLDIVKRLCYNLN